MKFPLNITKILVLTCDGADEVLIRFESPSSFPKLDKLYPTAYLPCAKFQAEKGYGREWVRQLGFPDSLVEEINTTALAI